MNLWLTIIGMGLVTYAIRLVPISLFTRKEMPDLMRRSLRYVPPAVLTAIIFPELFQPQGTLDISLGNERLLAGIAAALVALVTKNVLLTIAIGMISLWLLTV